VASTGCAYPSTPSTRLGRLGVERDLAKLIDRADGRRPSVLAARRQVRIVVRLDRPLLARVDALRPRFQARRAAILRAFVLLGVTMAETPT
jgi:hypothetical protein